MRKSSSMVYEIWRLAASEQIWSVKILHVDNSFLNARNNHGGTAFSPWFHHAHLFEMNFRISLSFHRFPAFVLVLLLYALPLCHLNQKSKFIFRPRAAKQDGLSESHCHRRTLVYSTRIQIYANPWQSPLVLSISGVQRHKKIIIRSDWRRKSIPKQDRMWWSLLVVKSAHFVGRFTQG